MAGFGHTTRKRLRGRSRTPTTRRRSAVAVGGDRAALGIVGLVFAIVGLFALGIVLGPLAMLCGWYAMGRRWAGAHSAPALVAVVLGAVDTALALIWLAGASATSGGLL
ncbi:small hydrophobic protein [Streptomyces sp. G45]|uniref:small hydrophobic protein n=1 Tax=Streptomyces sp. G45 TaxID=3406627 RepID=UPI003C1ACD61